MKLPLTQVEDLSDLISKFLPARNRKEINPIVLAWWLLIQADTFLYHVILQASGLKLECLKPSPNAFHYETYSRESIETLRQRVEDSRARVFDHTIGAVATLAALAVRSWISGIFLCTMADSYMSSLGRRI